MAEQEHDLARQSSECHYAAICRDHIDVMSSIARQTEQLKAIESGVRRIEDATNRFKDKAWEAIDAKATKGEYRWMFGLIFSILVVVGGGVMAMLWSIKGDANMASSEAHDARILMQEHVKSHERSATPNR